jgi:predicted acyl esterase
VIPWHPHTKEEKVSPGTIVPVEIGIWPTGIRFEEGEQLLLRVQGFLDQCVEFPQHIDARPNNINRGKHIIHLGGGYDSVLTIPVVPV